MIELSLLLFFPFFMAYAGFSDMFTMQISNMISLALIAGFVFFGFMIGMDIQTMLWHFAIFAIVLAVTFTLFALGIFGGGDAKLIPCTALWLGWEHTMTYIHVSALIGAILALVIMRWRYQPLPDRITNVEWVGRLYNAKNGIPYGVALAAGAMVVYPETLWMQHLYSLAISQ